MGAVYVVEHVNTGGQYALKILTDYMHIEDSHAERFRREARASARVICDNVVRIIDADTAPEFGGAPFLVMELLKGRDLGAVLADRKKLPWDETLVILKQVATALDKAHQAGIIHRDLKPENIFLHENELGQTIVKLVDFGISKMVSTGDDNGIASASVTRSNVIMGTPLYMAPEQASGHQEAIGSWTDNFALGLITVHMLTGEIYWQAGGIAQILVQLMMGERPVPTERWPELGTAFDAWFMKACNHDPTERFTRATQMIAELAVALSDENTQAAPLPLPSPRPRSPSLSAAADQAITWKPASFADGILGGGGDQPLAIPRYGQSASVPNLPEERQSATSLSSLSMGPAPGAPPRRRGVTAVVLASIALLLLAGIGTISVSRGRADASAAKDARQREPPQESVETPASDAIAISAPPTTPAVSSPPPATGAAAKTATPGAAQPVATQTAAAQPATTQPASGQRPTSRAVAPPVRPAATTTATTTTHTPPTAAAESKDLFDTQR